MIPFARNYAQKYYLSMGNRNWIIYAAFSSRQAFTGPDAGAHALKGVLPRNRQAGLAGLVWRFKPITGSVP